MITMKEHRLLTRYGWWWVDHFDIQNPLNNENVMTMLIELYSIKILRRQMASLQTHHHNQQHIMRDDTESPFNPFSVVDFWWIIFGLLIPADYGDFGDARRGLDQMGLRVLCTWFASSTTQRLISLIVYLFCDRWMLLAASREVWIEKKAESVERSEAN